MAAMKTIIVVSLLVHFFEIQCMTSKCNVMFLENVNIQ